MRSKHNKCTYTSTKKRSSSGRHVSTHDETWHGVKTNKAVWPRHADVRNVKDAVDRGQMAGSMGMGLFAVQESERDEPQTMACIAAGRRVFTKDKSASPTDKPTTFKPTTCTPPPRAGQPNPPGEEKLKMRGTIFWPQKPKTDFWQFLETDRHQKFFALIVNYRKLPIWGVWGVILGSNFHQQFLDSSTSPNQPNQGVYRGGGVTVSVS